MYAPSSSCCSWKFQTFNEFLRHNHAHCLLSTEPTQVVSSRYHLPPYFHFLHRTEIGALWFCQCWTIFNSELKVWTYWWTGQLFGKLSFRIWSWLQWSRWKGQGALTRAACLRRVLYFQFQFWIFKWHLRLKLKLKFKRGGGALTRAACLRSFLLFLLFILKTLLAERRHQRGSLLEKFWYFAKMQISNRVHQTLQDPLNQVSAPFYLKEKRSKRIVESVFAHRSEVITEGCSPC